MKNRIILIALLTLIGSAFLFFTLPVLAEDYGLNDTAGQITPFKDQVKNTNTYYDNFLQTKTGQIIGVVLSFVGTIFLILMIYAGILWMTARGNEQEITKAKDLIIAAIIGIIIVFAAYALTSFIGAQILK
jgi:TRAP-type C4-dicarboxylate transport system permease small subunit